jgi:glutamate dehydrogenase/leucine dehydrogenase
VLQGAFVHRTNRGQAAGGVRYWHYDTMEDYLRDGLRLAKGMTRKNALAGLWWGGGKGVMAERPDVDKLDPGIRAEVYRDYGRLMTAIRGCYVTAEDVGTHVTDMARIFSTSRFTTCIPPALGGSGNPSVPTARGVIAGMEAALEFLDLGTLEGRTVAVQGMGNVGEPLIRFLFEKRADRVIAGDIYPDVVEKVKGLFPGKNLEASVIEEGDDTLFETGCDLFSPNATGAVLNERTIGKLKARIVCGAANNQLEDAARDDRLLHERGILYVPDFLTNRMGIVNCANEQYGYVNRDPLFEQHLSRDWKHSIHRTALEVLGKAREANAPTAGIALQMADELSLVDHPLFGHRGRHIIASLVEDKWYEE